MQEQRFRSTWHVNVWMSTISAEFQLCNFSTGACVLLPPDNKNCKAFDVVPENKRMTDWETKQQERTDIEILRNREHATPRRKEFIQK